MLHKQERRKKRVKISSMNTKMRDERRGGGAPGARAEIHPQLVEMTVMEQVVPLQPMEDHAKQISTPQFMEDPILEQVNIFPEGTAAHGEPTLVQGKL